MSPDTFLKTYLKETFWEDTKKLSEEELEKVTKQRCSDLHQLCDRDFKNKEGIIFELLYALFGEEMEEGDEGYYHLADWIMADWGKRPLPRIPGEPAEIERFNYLNANQDKIMKISQFATDYIYGKGNNGAFVFARNNIFLKDLKNREQPKADPITLAIPQELIDKINKAKKYPYITANNRLYYACEIDGKIILTSKDVINPDKQYSPAESTYSLVTAGDIPQTISRLSLRPKEDDEKSKHRDPVIKNGKIVVDEKGKTVTVTIETKLAHLHQCDWLAKRTCPCYYSYKVVENDFLPLKSTNDEVVLYLNDKYNMQPIYKYEFNIEAEKGQLEPSKGILDLDPYLKESLANVPLNSKELFELVKQTQQEIMKTGKLEFSDSLMDFAFKQEQQSTNSINNSFSNTNKEQSNEL